MQNRSQSAPHLHHLDLAGNAPARFSPQPVEPSLDNADSGRGQRLLIVADEAPVCIAPGGYFGRRGYNITTLSDPREALEILRRAPDRFDLVITDLNTARFSGIDLACPILSLNLRPLAQALGQTSEPAFTGMEYTD